MRVILIKDVPGYGTFGDIINVKDGFANNYLIPRGLALPATEGNIKHVQEILKQKKRKLEREKAKAQEIAEKINGLVLEISRPVGVTGKLYGAITVGEIAEKIKETAGVEVDKRKIMLRAPIKNLGRYNITVKLHPEVNATVTLDIKPSEVK
ncbi:MAG TPA: 50S ribosomal protein L9 [Aquifex aeolicus]|uniref:Large ribosomal subunit protein bL9 n=1 Tax=Aquifex aeolicus TaxID=63363 RepID=A0A9D0YPX6_AQUAO|nr:50S ribosomal protein L9 [Aquificales bacterium]HIP97804.1 50S ribosomal protein L9 [Aquifex aeolicus]HIQ26366.1 50S ribosomal protein L9 [Aquifex aeolicus]